MIIEKWVNTSTICKNKVSFIEHEKKKRKIITKIYYKLLKHKLIEYHNNQQIFLSIRKKFDLRFYVFSTKFPRMKIPKIILME